jgi:hypothetical protein
VGTKDHRKIPAILLLTLWMESATRAMKISAIKAATIANGFLKHVGRLQAPVTDLKF